MAKAHSFEALWDRSLGGNDTSFEIGHGLALFCSVLCWVFVKVFFRFEVKHQDKIQAFIGKTRGAVVVSPHTSYLDVVIMFLSVRPKQWVRLLGRDTLFKAAGGILGFILTHAGAIPIKRDSADRLAMKRASRALKNGELIGLFPEGTRRNKGNKIPALHGGAALIARMGRAPLIPLGLKNVGKVKEKGRFVRFPKITAEFGDPVSLDSFDFLEKDDRLEGCTWYVMREAFALSYDLLPEEIDMVKLFPESKDFTQIFREHPITPFDPGSLDDYEPQA